ncbi:MAG: PqqD family protein [Clostridia bacterium]|nr:PqqD family protein [Clostridia bacterium]
MKIRNGFVARDVGNRTFVVAVGELSKSFNAMITLNETGKAIWQALKTDTSIDEIVEKLLLEFEDAEKELVKRDVIAFVNKLDEANVLEK